MHNSGSTLLFQVSCLSREFTHSTIRVQRIPSESQRVFTLFRKRLFQDSHNGAIRQLLPTLGAPSRTSHRHRFPPRFLLNVVASMGCAVTIRYMHRCYENASQHGIILILFISHSFSSPQAARVQLIQLIRTLSGFWWLSIVSSRCRMLNDSMEQVHMHGSKAAVTSIIFMVLITCTLDSTPVIY